MEVIQWEYINMEIKMEFLKKVVNYMLLKILVVLNVVQSNNVLTVFQMVMELKDVMLQKSTLSGMLMNMEALVELIK